MEKTASDPEIKWSQIPAIRDAAEQQATTRTHPLARIALDEYTHQLLDHRLLTDAEELQLFERVAHGETEATSIIIAHNMRLVAKFALPHALRQDGMSYSDLIQEGVFGLMRAIPKHDPAKGKFYFTAKNWVRRDIDRSIKDRGTLIRKPIHIHEEMGRIRRAQERISQQHDRATISEELLEKETGLTANKIRLVVEAFREPASLDAQTDPTNPNSESLGQKTRDNQPSPTEVVLKKEQAAEIQSALSLLDDSEARAVRMRFGFDDEDGSSYQQIGDVLGISRSAAKKLIDDSLLKLKDTLDQDTD